MWPEAVGDQSLCLGLWGNIARTCVASRGAVKACPHLFSKQDNLYPETETLYPETETKYPVSGYKVSVSGDKVSVSGYKLSCFGNKCGQAITHHSSPRVSLTVLFHC